MSINPNNGLRECNGCGCTINEGDVYLNGFFKIRKDSKDTQFGFYDFCAACKDQISSHVNAPSKSWKEKEGVV